MYSVRLLYTVTPGEFIGMFTITLFSGVQPLMLAWASKLMMDILTKQNSTSLISPLLAMVCIHALGHVAAEVDRHLGEITSDQLTLYLRKRIISAVAQIDYSAFDNPEFLNRLSRAQQESGYRPVSIVRTTFLIIRNTITTTSAIVVTFGAGWWFPPFLLAAAIPAILVEAKYGSDRFRYSIDTEPESRRMGYISGLATSRPGSRDMVIYNLVGHYTDIVNQLHASLMSRRWPILRRKTKQTLFTAILSRLVMMCIYGVIAKGTLNGHLTIGQFGLYTTAVVSLEIALGSLVGSIGSMQSHSLFFSTLTSFIEQAPRPLSSSGSGVRAPDSVHEIEFRNVTFIYPGASSPALDKVSFHIKAGQKVAIVGENGAGKTTMVKLLLGLYKPTNGNIYINGINIHKIPQCEYLRLFTPLFQDFVRYAFTVHDNIKISDLDSSEHIMEEVIQRTGCDFIKQFPKGFETELTRQFSKGGVQLSEGQWQRIALARAFYRKAPIIVLDEPTASLDAKQERELFDYLLSVADSHTISLYITHRMNTVIKASHIIVLEKGRKVEEGTHSELIENAAAYSDLFSAQAEAYRSGA